MEKFASKEHSEYPNQMSQHAGFDLGLYWLPTTFKAYMS